MKIKSHLVKKFVIGNTTVAISIVGYHLNKAPGL